jgi:hypothetical protein
MGDTLSLRREDHGEDLNLVITDLGGIIGLPPRQTADRQEAK